MRILIVDDMPAVRSILRNMLESLGYDEVDEAEDGQEAWDMVLSSARAKTRPYRLVISDWNMPALSGVDLLRAIRSAAECQGTSFFMVTALGEQARIVEATSAGADAYVVKPFDTDDLREKISLIPQV